MKLHIEGNRILNKAGEEILLRGVNCAGLEWDAGNTTVLPAVLLAVDEWNANIIRLPVSQDRWFGWSPAQKNLFSRFIEDSVAFNMQFHRSAPFSF